MNSPTSPSDRYDRGDAILSQIDGSDGQAVVDSLGDLGRYLIEFGFGDVYARPGLTLRDRELITVAMLAAVRAHESQLDFHLLAARRVGISVDELREVIINVAPYAGFPAAINAMNRLHALEANLPG